MTRLFHLRLLTALVLVLTCPLAAVADTEAPLWQLSVGALEFDNESAQWRELSANNVDINFPIMPSLSLDAEYPFHQGWVHWGLNPGGSIAGMRDDIEVTGTLGNADGTTTFEFDNSLLLFELHLGGYVRGRLNDRITTYAAAGPMFVYGAHDIEDETASRTPTPLPDGATLTADGDGSAVNFGYYARVGLDFEVRADQHLGVGFRYQSVELDFDDTLGKVDFAGPQFVLTFSRRY